MPITLCQFVTGVASSPTVVLDLNDTTRASGFMLAEGGLGVDPPPLRRATVSTMIADGERIPASAYGNRLLKVPLRLTGATEDGAAAALRALLEELDKPRNWLRVKIGTTQVFFRTHRSELTLQMARNLLRDGSVTLEIPADPFGYGPEEVAVNNLSISNNTATGTRPLSVDISNVKGDVPTPAIIEHASGSLDPVARGWLRRTVLYAVRRHGNPAAVAWATQAENMVMASNSAIAGSGLTMFSGNGANYAILTPPNANAQLFAQGYLFGNLGTPESEVSGTYRVLAAVRQTVATDTFVCHIRWGTSQGIINSDVRVATVLDAGNVPTTDPILIDLGVVSAGANNVSKGLSSTARTVIPPYIWLYGKRTSGTGLLHLDYILAVPADEELAYARYKTWGQNVTYNTSKAYLDGENDIAYATSSIDAMFDGGVAALMGKVPQLSPAPQTNRLFIIRGINTDTHATESYNVTVSYHPRYLLVPGATT